MVCCLKLIYFPWSSHTKPQKSPAPFVSPRQLIEHHAGALGSTQTSRCLSGKQQNRVDSVPQRRQAQHANMMEDLVPIRRQTIRLETANDNPPCPNGSALRIALLSGLQLALCGIQLLLGELAWWSTMVSIVGIYVALVHQHSFLVS